MKSLDANLVREFYLEYFKTVYRLGLKKKNCQKFKAEVLSFHEKINYLLVTHINSFWAINPVDMDLRNNPTILIDGYFD